MKKIFIALFALIVVISLTTFTCFATAENGAEPSGENTGVELPAETPESATETEDPSESAEKFYSAWLDKLTDATLWVNLGITLSGILGVIVFIRSKFGSIAGLINTLGTLVKAGATKDELKAVVTGAVEGAREAYRAESEAMKKKFEEQLEVNNKLLSVITIFVTNAKINPHAKTEMLNLLTSVTPMLESVEKTVTAANKAISEAEALEESVPTPALDEITAQAEKSNEAAIPVMKLG